MNCFLLKLKPLVDGTYYTPNLIEHSAIPLIESRKIEDKLYVVYYLWLLIFIQQTNNL